MKKSILIGLLGVVVNAATSSWGQGFIKLENYNTSGPNVTYGEAGIPANGVSGTTGTVGGGLLAGWTAGLYYAQGDITGSVPVDPYGFQDPTILNAGFVLGTGTGSTAAFFTSTFNTPGQFFSSTLFQASAAAGSVVTIEVVAYSGANYASATYRAHSAAFTMTTLVGGAVNPAIVGNFMPAFSIFIIPEPSAFALLGMGGIVMLTFRRRK